MSSARTLHVTNGDSVIYLFKKAGILGTHVPWRDVLHEGPVPPGVDLQGTSMVRGRYLASRGHGSPIKVMHDFEVRDAALMRAPDYGEIVLWFEHDLYDQLQILQVLSVLGAMELPPGTVTMIASDSYLGAMTADEIGALHPKRRTVTTALFERARAAWDAFTSDDPHALLPFARAETEGLPHLRAAIARLLEEFPGADGLSRSHRQALASVAQGPAREDDVFRRAQAREEAPFLGDTTFAAILRDLRDERAPLIEGEGAQMTPTALGRSLLAGDGDWLAHAPADRWIGGVHIEGATPPRWDDTRRAFVPDRAGASEA